MASSITLIEEVAVVAAAAFKHDEQGHVLFGFGGRSPEPLPVDAVVHSSVILRDYLMERGVKYSVRLVACGLGTELEIADVPGGREEEVLWFARKHLVACGLQLAENNDGRQAEHPSSS